MKLQQAVAIRHDHRLTRRSDPRHGIVLGVHPLFPRPAPKPNSWDLDLTFHIGPIL